MDLQLPLREDNVEPLKELPRIGKDASISNVSSHDGMFTLVQHQCTLFKINYLFRLEKLHSYYFRLHLYWFHLIYHFDFIQLMRYLCHLIGSFLSCIHLFLVLLENICTFFPKNGEAFQLWGGRGMAW
ncbi:hypothetical protein SAY87_005448 [Trapa incisa]|uniref:Uncharacterized protein n=1 Tax=Trapa incisa TaxID=236973 RepID=A0AAN7KCI6_9MYRT|nr:hypothetical protein SAY87_005448 [Trapa incisa]